MNKLFLIFFIITTLFFSSCKKEVSLDNLSNQAQLDTLILNNLQIPFEKYDTVFVDEPLREVCGTLLPKEKEVELHKHYDLKFDSIQYFSSFKNKTHIPILKWTNVFFNKYSTLIKNRIKDFSSSDSLYKNRLLEVDSIIYCKKVFLTISTNIITNDSLSLIEFYKNCRNVVESHKVYVFENDNWFLKSIKINQRRLGSFYSSPNHNK